MRLARSALSVSAAQYLSNLPQERPSNEWIWAEMDRVWQELGLDNSRPLDGQPIGEFYEHPVWIMNGVFSAVDPVSAAHRRAIAHHVASGGAASVADYGGGFGELARQIIEAHPDTTVSIIEPYPSKLALAQLEDEPRIEFVAVAQKQAYDFVIAQDVLEHVEEPIALASDLAESVRSGGTLVLANNFTPIIQCHLPGTFHLRHSFRLVMRALGLKYRGRVEGADHAEVYEVGDRLHRRRALAAEKVSRFFGPAVDWLQRTYRRLRPRK